MAKRVSPSEAAELLKQGWLYVDVRSKPEFAAGRPKGSINVPLMDADPSGRMLPNPRSPSAPVTRIAPGSESLARYLNPVSMTRGLWRHRSLIWRTLSQGFIADWRGIAALRA